MTIDEVINCIDKKDWERAFNTNLGRVPAMLKAITDSRKLIGRTTAIYFIYSKFRPVWYGEVEDILQKNFKEFGINPKELNDYDISANKALMASSVYDDVMVKLQEKKEQAAEKKRQADLARQKAISAQKVEKGIKSVLAYCASISEAIVYSRANWNSWGGRIGQYSHTWYKRNGSTIKNSENVLYKYDDGNHFIEVYIPSGYSYEYNVNYDSVRNYYMDVTATIRNNATYDSDSQLSVYKLPKLTAKLQNALNTVLAESNADLTAEEKAKVFSIFNN